MAFRRRSVPKRLETVLRTVHPAPQELVGARAFAWWTQSLPARLVKNARPVRFEYGTLWVHVRNAVWAQEMQMMSADIHARMQLACPKANVKQLRFRIGPLPEWTPTPKKPTPKVTVPLTTLPDNIARALAHLKDNDLRQVIGQAAASVLAMDPAENLPDNNTQS